jgi:hypothetical protein
MLIDLAEDYLRRKEPIIPLARSEMSEPPDDLEEQVKLLDESCPRYDVNNIWGVLHPDLISGDYLPARKRNAELIGKRNALLKIASNAPLGPPWDHFYFEFRLNDFQRGGILVRWDANDRCHKCTALCDSLRTPGMIELTSEAFEIQLGSDDLFAAYKFGKIPEAAKSSIPMQAEVVRTAIELLNWDREDVPTAVHTHEKKGKVSEKHRQSKSKKSSPTIIKFEPFLKKNLSGVHRANEGGHAGTVLHLVRGHYKNYKHDAPRFGQKPVLGKTYGRLWVRPHQSGSPAGSDPKTPMAVIKIGDLACA